MLVGCGVSEEKFIDRICAKTECSSEDFDETTCKDYLKEYFGECEYDAKLGAACLDAIDDVECNEELPECAAVFECEYYPRDLASV